MWPSSHYYLKNVKLFKNYSIRDGQNGLVGKGTHCQAWPPEFHPCSSVLVMELVVLPVFPPPSHMAQAALIVLTVRSAIPEVLTTIPAKTQKCQQSSKLSTYLYATPKGHRSRCF